MFNLELYEELGGDTRAFIERKAQELTGKVLRNRIDRYLIDSCYTFDNGYETGITKDTYHWAIVETYKTFEEMKKGHKKWCKYIEKNKPEVLFDTFDGEDVLL